jgi:predicted CopG family antitoxin
MKTREVGQHYKTINVSPEVYDELEKLRGREMTNLRLRNLSWNDYISRIISTLKGKETHSLKE